MKTIASPKAPLPVQTPNQLEERSRRARTEPMSVLPLGDGLYEVESASDHTYLVDLVAGRCTCPDHIFRNVRCKHSRRVAIEITDGRTPPPGQLAVECRNTDCHESVFVDEEDDGSSTGDEESGQPVYCEAHTLWPGDTVVDRETSDRLTVVDVSDLRADAVRIDAADCTVAEYGTNSAYDPDVPVVGVVYPHATVRPNGVVYPHATVRPNGVVPNSLRVYVFPRTRLEKRA
ncbi:hypothetical protein [Natrialba chahannaoensis]|uniref:hypothetical protein n=1 Tax=Natrialba chahannaoensis TaxID=68911 RepID=UPI000677FACA|nr:hypothetical protein [Natrialba chahannaoensis]